MKRRERGLTLIELMVTLAVAIVLLAIGIPAFRAMEANSRAAAQANAMVTAVTLARSEAVGRGIPVSVCGKKSRDLSNLECRGSIADEDKPCPNSAAAPNPWCNGWLVFLDTGLDANPSAGDVLRSFAAPRPGSTINPAPNGTWFFSFNSRGERMPPNAVAFRLEQTDTTAQQDRCVRVAAGGMISTTHIDDGSPCP